MKLSRKRKGPITMPIASMGDIAFLLIIFFMVCSNFVKESQVEYKSPTAEELAAVEKSGLSVAVDKDGEIYLEGKPVAGPDALKAALEKRLLEAQKKGEEIGDAKRLDMDAAEIKKIYPEDTFPAHAAWLDWPWKLHCIGGKKVELYNLESDPKIGRASCRERG